MLQAGANQGSKDLVALHDSAGESELQRGCGLGPLVVAGVQAESTHVAAQAAVFRGIREEAALHAVRQRQRQAGLELAWDENTGEGERMKADLHRHFTAKKTKQSAYKYCNSFRAALA